MLLIADILEDRLQPATFELAAFARRFPGIPDDRVKMVFAGKNICAMAGSTAGGAGMEGFAVEHDALYHPEPDFLAQCLIPIVQRLQPGLVAFIHSVRAVQAAATLAWKVNGSCIPGVESVIVDTDGRPVFRRAIAGGKRIAEIKAGFAPAIVTLMPGAFPVEDRTSCDFPSGHIERIPPEGEPRVNSLKLHPAAQANHRIEEADVIVAAGRGIGAPKHLGMIRELAGMFNNAALAASRPLCDLGWMPMDRQVGVTGRTVSPSLYLACGISGTQQHVAGMRGSRMIVALNHDRHAPIFNISHIGIVEDLHAFLPVLIEKLRRSKA